MTTPNPGSTEALDLGCTCPVLDNHQGHGYRGQAGVFIYAMNCPVHFADECEKTESLQPVRGDFDLPVWML